MFIDEIEKLRTSIEKNGEKFLTPRLEAVHGTVYQLTREDESVFLCIMPFKLMESFPYRPHCVIGLSAEDWTSVLDGKRSIMSKVLAGRCDFLKHERRYIMHLSMLLQAVLLEEHQ